MERTKKLNKIVILEVERAREKIKEGKFYTEKEAKRILRL